MDASTPPQLHDSLDLAVLRNDIVAEQKWTKLFKRSPVYAFIAVGIAIGIVPFALFVATISRPLAVRILEIVMWGLILFLILYFAIFAVLVYRHHQSYLKRLVAYVPDFVPRATMRDSLPVIAAIPVVGLVTVPVLVFFRDWMIDYFVVCVIVFVSFLALLGSYFLLMLWARLGGLSRINRLLTIFPGQLLLLANKSYFLIYAGQVDEAAQILRDLLSRRLRRNVYQIPLLLNNFGYCLFVMGHYQDALPIIEAGIRIQPVFSHGYFALAEWYLEQHCDSDRALELTEIGLELTKPNNAVLVASGQAMNARALALTGRDTRAEAMLTQALEAAERLPAFVSAGIHYEAGHTRLPQGNREAAAEHFRKAIELDPNGISGKLAQGALDALTTPT